MRKIRNHNVMVRGGYSPDTFDAVTCFSPGCGHATIVRKDAGSPQQWHATLAVFKRQHPWQQLKRI